MTTDAPRPTMMAEERSMAYGRTPQEDITMKLIAHRLASFDDHYEAATAGAEAVLEWLDWVGINETLLNAMYVGTVEQDNGSPCSGRRT